MWQVPVAVLAAALLFNLGQGVLRRPLPLYLQQVFVANLPDGDVDSRWSLGLASGWPVCRLAICCTTSNADD